MSDVCNQNDVWIDRITNVIVDAWSFDYPAVPLGYYESNGDVENEDESFPIIGLGDFFSHDSLLVNCSYSKYQPLTLHTIETKTTIISIYRIKKKYRRDMVWMC